MIILKQPVSQHRETFNDKNKWNKTENLLLHSA